MRMLNLFFGLLLLPSIVFCGGCAYTTKTMLPSHIKAIYIDNFKNSIDIVCAKTNKKDYKLYYPDIERYTTNAVVNRFISDGTLKIVDRETADAVLEGEVTEYSKQPLRYSEDNDIELYRVNVIVKITFKDMHNNGKVLFSQTVVGDSNQFIAGEFASTEQEAVDNALEDLARRVLEVVVDYGW